MVRMKTLAFLALLVGACGSRDDNLGTADLPPEEAKEDCGFFTLFLCRTVTGCDNSLTYSCATAYSNLCDGVIGENIGVGKCETDIGAEACSQLTAGTLPGSCTKLFITNGSRAPACHVSAIRRRRVASRTILTKG